MWGRILNGPKIGEQPELLAQRNVDAGKSAANGRGRHRPLQRYPGAFDGFGQLFGNVLVILFVSFRARLEGFPVKFETRGFEYANRRSRDFGSDAVALE